jgi:hypothetical protein
VRIDLPLSALREAVGELTPGIYVITGPIGSGKTQLALQIVTSLAEHDTPIALSAPRIAPRELGARIEGIRSRTDWSDHRKDARELPASIELVHQLAASSGPVMLADHFSDDPAALLSRMRRAVIDHDAVVLVVLEPANSETVKGFVPAEILRRSPPEIAEWIGVPARAAAEADVLLVLAPDRPRDAPGWMSLELAVAKHRWSIPGRAPLRFNGTWFEDVPEHVDLGID